MTCYRRIPLQTHVTCMCNRFHKIKTEFGLSLFGDAYIICSLEMHGIRQPHVYGLLYCYNTTDMHVTNIPVCNKILIFIPTFVCWASSVRIHHENNTRMIKDGFPVSIFDSFEADRSIKNQTDVMVSLSSHAVWNLLSTLEWRFYFTWTYVSHYHETPDSFLFLFQFKSSSPSAVFNRSRTRWLD